MVERPTCADVAARRTAAGCHSNLGRNMTLGPAASSRARRPSVNGIIYLVGLIVIVMAILSFVGIR
jgi:hypothetical protein